MTGDDALPDALGAAAVAVIRERGLSGFSLREVARRVDVSHAAPGYHFHNAVGLLTALAIEAFVVLRENQEAAIVGIDDPDLQAAGLAAYSVLERTVQEFADRDNPALGVGDAADLAWSAMQGLLVLLPKMTLVRGAQSRRSDDPEATAATFCHLLAAGFTATGTRRGAERGRGGT